MAASAPPASITSASPRRIIACLAEGVGAGGAGGDDAEVGAARAELDGEQARAHVADERRDRERRDLAGAALEHPALLHRRSPCRRCRCRPGCQPARDPRVPCRGPSPGRLGRRPQSQNGCSGRCGAPPSGPCGPRGIQSRTSAPIWVANGAGSNCVTRAMPFRPATKLAQKVSTSWPRPGRRPGQ